LNIEAIRKSLIDQKQSMSVLVENWGEIREKIAVAERKAGRESGSVRLLPATKTVEPERLQELVDFGVRVFGENRVQEAKAKQGRLPGSVRWEFIGGLQRNKAKEAVRLFDLIHSVDNVELCLELHKRAMEAGKIQPVLIEVNIAGEGSKHGIAPEQAGRLAALANEQSCLEVRGFMTVAPFFEDLEKVRPYFAKMREARDAAERETGLLLPELSMGMSHDFETAIGEGATVVRIGSALFGERAKLKP
jgi:pyridoxal phosphate enzyme (YggS family)